MDADSRQLRLTQPDAYKCGQDEQGDQPPKPPDAARLDRLRPEFPFYEFVVVEIFIRQSEMAGIRGFRPAGLLIRAAFGAGPGVARHFCAAVRTDVRSHNDLRTPSDFANCQRM